METLGSEGLKVSREERGDVSQPQKPRERRMPDLKQRKESRLTAFNSLRTPYFVDEEVINKRLMGKVTMD